jgi:hypothetical protein
MNYDMCMQALTPNLMVGDEQRDFFVWVDPQAFLVQANVYSTGQFSSAELIDPNETLPFLRNEKFGGIMTPFLRSITHDYNVEFNLEMSRRRDYSAYPCRLISIFLFDSESTAQKYGERHPEHVDSRVLQRVKTVGRYTYSWHDSSWIDYLRIPHFGMSERIDAISQDYWTGRKAIGYTLTSFGKTWRAEPLAEILYIGTVEFYDRSFLSSMPAIGGARVIQRTPSDMMKKFLHEREGS